MVSAPIIFLAIEYHVFEAGSISRPAVKSASNSTNRWNSGTDSTVWMREDDVTSPFRGLLLRIVFNDMPEAF